MNLHLVFVILFVQSNKVAINEMKTSFMDLTFLVSGILCIFTLLLILIFRLSFTIPVTSRKMFFCRAIIGLIHLLGYIIGNTLLPITIMQTLSNTTPFWATLFACCMIKEKVRRIEIIAIFISFGAILLITWTEAKDEKGEKERVFFKDSPMKAGMLGCASILLKAIL